MLARIVTVATLIGLLGCASSAPLPPGTAWTPSAWQAEDTIALRSDCPEQGEYWFPVWLIVIDDQLYVRLGSKAAGRIQCTRAMPALGVRIAGHQFDRVHATETPELAEKVSAAMAAKYWTDIFVRGVSHPLTLRLAPDGAGAPPTQR